MVKTTNLAQHTMKSPGAYTPPIIGFFTPHLSTPCQFVTVSTNLIRLSSPF